MKNNKINRRGFVKKSAALTIGSSFAISTAAKSVFNSKGLPTVFLGKTGVRIPRIVIGTGSRWLAVQDEEKALEIINYALDQGLYHLDTAAAYQNKNGGYVSEERLGRVLKTRRKEVFLSTKVQVRDPEEAKAVIERSLTRLNTDYVDLLQIHNLKSVEEVRDIRKPGGVLDVVKKAKEEGVAKFIGFTGHTSAEAMTEAANTFGVDTMLIALNHQKKNKQEFEQRAVSAAKKNGLGVLGMKVVRPRENIDGLSAKELIKYALSLEELDAIVIGTDSMKVLKENIDILKNFVPLSEQKMEKLRMSLKPYYDHKHLEWMHHNYNDGVWV